MAANGCRSRLAGIPFYDRLRNFAGFKGFGVCRDLDGLNRLDALRRFELFTDPPAHTIEPVTEPELKAEPPPAVSDIPEPIAELPEPIIDAHSQQADLDRQVETPPTSCHSARSATTNCRR